MFQIFSRLNPIHIDAFTYSESYELYSPKPAIEFIPQWWKSLDNTFVGDPAFPQVEYSTMKRCNGFIENFKNGFIIPLWSDLAITLSTNPAQRFYRYMFSDGQSVAESHNTNQYTGFIDPSDIQHIKLVAPWRIKEKTGIQFACVQPTWNLGNLNKHLTVLPGITDMKYQDNINVNIMLTYPTEAKEEHLLLHAGTPIYHIIPLSERPFKIKTHCLTKTEFDKIGIGALKFNNTYRERKRLVDKLEEKKGCPFK